MKTLLIVLCLFLTACMLNACKDSPEIAFANREKKFTDSLKQVYVLDTIITGDEFLEYDFATKRAIYSRGFQMLSQVVRGLLSQGQCEKIGERYYREVTLYDSVKYKYISVNFYIQDNQSGANYFPKK